MPVRRSLRNRKRKSYAEPSVSDDELSSDRAKDRSREEEQEKDRTDVNPDQDQSSLDSYTRKSQDSDEDDKDVEDSDNDDEEESMDRPRPSRRKRGRPKGSNAKSRSSNSSTGNKKRDYGPKSERTCPFCNKVFSIVTGLAYHLEHKVCQKSKPRQSLQELKESGPFPILEPGDMFCTMYGVVKVIKDDRVGKDFGNFNINDDLKDARKKYQKQKEKIANRRQKVYQFVAKKSRQRRNVLLKHYLEYKNTKERNRQSMTESDDQSEEYAQKIWREYYPVSTPNEILSGIYKKSLAIPLLRVDHPDEVGLNPTEPASSYPDRIVECLLVKDDRKVIYDLDSEGDGRLSQVNVAMALVQKTQKRIKSEATRSKRDIQSTLDKDCDSRQRAIKLYLKRKDLTQPYNACLPLYCCKTCGKKFTSRVGCKTHVDQNSCGNDCEAFAENRMARWKDVEDSIEDQLKPPPWLLPPLEAPPGDMKRKRHKEFPGWIVFHPDKSSIYPQVFKHLKLKRGSNNSNFMQKKWDAIGPGRKKMRKSRAKHPTPLSVVHQVDEWMDVGDKSVYPSVMATLFSSQIEKRVSSRQREASKKAKEQVSVYLEQEEAHPSIDCKNEEEYKPEEEHSYDENNNVEFLPHGYHDVDVDMPPLPVPDNVEAIHTNHPLIPYPENNTEVNDIVTPTTLVTTKESISLDGKEENLPNEAPPKKRRRRRNAESKAPIKPTEPVVIDIRPLVEEVRAGRYPSMKVYNGEHLNICFLCKTEGEDVFHCEFCMNSEHLDCVKSKVTIQDPEPDDDFMCHRCIQTVLSRRARAEKRRLEKLNDAMKENGVSMHGISLEQAKNAAKLKREIIWSQSEFDSHVMSYNKCPTGGPGGLICCGPCTTSYSRLLSETAKEMEVQTLSGVGREVSELLELLHDAQVRLKEAVDVSNCNDIRREMIRDPSEEMEGQVGDPQNPGWIGLMDIFN